MPCPYLAVLPTCRLADLHGGGGTRTHDLAVKSRMLYQLSYAPDGAQGRTLRRGDARARLSRLWAGYSVRMGRMGGMGGTVIRGGWL